MGEELYEELARLERASRRPADAGAHLRAGRQPQGAARLSRPPTPRERRQFELRQSHRRRAGSIDELVARPGRRARALEPKRNPKIVLPPELFGAERRNSAGVDLSDPLVREPLLERLKALEARSWTAKPTLGKGEGRPIIHRTIIGSRSERRSKRQTLRSIGWFAPATPRRSVGMRSAAKRGRSCSNAPPTSTRRMREEFFSLCTREAGKTLLDAVLEVREAVDFLRFYASEARRQFTKPLPLPGPTGEQNELRLHGRGVIAAFRRGISRWRSSPAWCRRRWPRAMRSSRSRRGKRR